MVGMGDVEGSGRGKQGCGGRCGDTVRHHGQLWGHGTQQRDVVGHSEEWWRRGGTQQHG